MTFAIHMIIAGVVCMRSLLAVLKAPLIADSYHEGEIFFIVLSLLLFGIPNHVRRSCKLLSSHFDIHLEY